ncbi:MAG: FAD-binding protein [Luteitalea sp.]|nr:FAD-binding protein [Luteitalea sp.]
MPVNKRTFLKMSAAVLASAALPREIESAQNSTERNWAGNIEYSTAQIHSPKTLDEVRQVVKRCRKLRALGTRHSFNQIADSTENLVSVWHLDQVVSLDKASRTVTVGAGMRYGELSEYLHEKGFALHNLASLPHISVAGACATGTHGSGVENGNLATAVLGLEVVTADGEVLTLSRDKDGDRFDGTVVALGGLGVVTAVTLEIQPTFSVRQDVYQNLPVKQVRGHLDEILASGYSVSLFTDWQGDTVNQVWVKTRIGEETAQTGGPELFGAKLAAKNLHPIAELSAENCTEQMGVAGPWHERLPHFRLNFTPSSGEELQSEYFVPRDHALKALTAVYELRDRIAPHLLISEVRTIDADRFWMSPCYQQPCLTIHFTWKQDWPAVKALLPVIEQALEPFDVRPHWGKLFTIPSSRLSARYQRLPAFRELLAAHDPQGKFRNAFFETHIFGGA